jgi:predicted DNA-binding protein with PD1-like motif
VLLVDGNAVTRGIVRVEPGEDLVEALKALAEAAGWRDAVVTGAGALELVELLSPDGSNVTLENAELTSLAGRIHRGAQGQAVVSLAATLSHASGARSGRITAAMTGGLLLVVDAITEKARATAASEPPRAQPQRSDTMRAAAPQPPVPQPAPEPRVEATPTPSPAAAPIKPADLDGQRSASKPLSQSFTTKPMLRPIPAPKPVDDDAEEIHEVALPEAGDILEHPQLGRCEVIGDDEAGGTRILLPSGKLRVLRLDALEVLRGVADDSGRHVYKIAGPRRHR